MRFPTGEMARVMREQFRCWMHDGEEKAGVLQEYGFATLQSGMYRLDDPLRVTVTSSEVLLERPWGQLIVTCGSRGSAFIRTASPARSTPLASLRGPQGAQSLDDREWVDVPAELRCVAMPSIRMQLTVSSAGNVIRPVR